MRIIKFIVASLFLIAILMLLSIGDFVYPTDYTNLTVMEPPLPDIAIDIREEYNDDYMRLLWQINKGTYNPEDYNDR